MPSRTLPFSFEGLPHLPVGVTSRARLLARGIGAAAPAGARVWSAGVRGVGRVTMRLASVDLVPWDAGAPGVAPCRLSLVRDGRRARLSIDPFFAQGLVRGVLGAPAPAVVRPLAASERGILAAVVAAVLAAQGGGLTVSWDDAPVAGESVSVDLVVKAWELSGRVRLELPLAWLADTSGTVAEAAAALIESELAVELGRTDLDREPWARAEAGDAVLFAGLSPLPAAAAWPCSLRVGSHQAPGELAADGTLLCRGPFTSSLEAPMKDTDKSEDAVTAAVSAQAPAASPTALLAEAPVEIVAELGRVSVRGDELLGLTRGAVLALGPRRPDLVSLRVGGREWARGELVTIEDQLGVRITELRPR